MAYLPDSSPVEVDVDSVPHTRHVLAGQQGVHRSWVQRTETVTYSDIPSIAPLPQSSPV